LFLLNGLRKRIKPMVSPLRFSFSCIVDYWLLFLSAIEFAARLHAHVALQNEYLQEDCFTSDPKSLNKHASMTFISAASFAFSWGASVGVRVCFFPPLLFFFLFFSFTSPYNFLSSSELWI
jgi:hypothetical protein